MQIKQQSFHYDGWTGFVSATVGRLVIDDL